MAVVDSKNSGVTEEQIPVCSNESFDLNARLAGAICNLADCVNVRKLSVLLLLVCK